MGLPGVKVGPLDPDATSEFGQVNQQANARTLIRLHSRMHPPALIGALALKRDDERTKGLYEAGLDEVQSYAEGLRLENGDPVLPEGARITGASVRGQRDRPQVVCFTYEIESGRVGKWFAPYDRDKLPHSAELGDEFLKVQEMKDRGIVEFDREGAGRYLDQREIARLRRENDALRRNQDAMGGGEDVELADSEEPEGGSGSDTRPDAGIVEENEQLRRQVEEQRQRLEALEAAIATQHLHPDAPARQEAESGAGESENDLASEEPPFEGYDDVKAPDLVKRVRDPEQTSDEDAQAVLEFERRHQNRKTVVLALEERLGRTG